MANDIGVKLAVEGEKTFTSAIKAANAQIKAMDAELKAAASSMDSSRAKTSALEKQIEIQTTKLDVLNKKYDIEKSRLSELGTALDNARKEYGENSKEATKAANAYNNQASVVANLEKQIAETNSALSEERSELEKLQNRLNTAGQQMQAFGEKAAAAGEKLSKLGTNATKYVTTPIIAAFTAAIKATSDFDSAMSQVSAVSGAIGAEFDALRAKAREMGEQTKFSATEAAEAINYMAMAGWKTEEMLNGIEGIMNLAAASGEDLAATSDIVTDALTAFGLSAEEAGHFSDVLAAASSNANTNVSMMGETFKYAAPLAGALGYDVEDVANAIGLMANSGIKGAQAGTAMRGWLTRLAKPTKESGIAMDDLGLSITNTDGSMKTFMEVIEETRDAFSGLTEDEKAQYAAMLAGQNGMSGLLAVVNASESDFEKLSSAIRNCDGTVEQMAETMQDNLAGQITILKSQLSELAIGLGDLLMPSIRNLVDTAQGFVDKLNAMDDGTKELILKTGLAAAAFGPATTVLGKTATGLGNAAVAAGTFASSLAGGDGVAATLAATLGTGGAVGLAIIGTAALTAGMVLAAQKIGEAVDPLHGLEETLKSIADAQKKAVENDNVIALANRYQELRESIESGTLSEEALAAAESELSKVRAELSSTTDGVISTTGEYNDALDETVENLKATAAAERDRANASVYASLIDGAKDYNAAISNQRRTVVELTAAEKQRHALEKAMADDGAAAYKSLSNSIETLRNNLEGGIFDTSTVEGAEALKFALEDIETQYYALTGIKVSFEFPQEAFDAVERLNFSVEDLAGSYSNADEEVQRLNTELEASKAITDRYSADTITLMQSGYIDVTKAADMLGISVEDLQHKMTTYEQETQAVASATGALTDAQKEAIDAAEAEAQAAEKEQAAFEELVNTLAGMPDILKAAGYSAEELAALLESAGMSAQEFSSAVTRTRDSIVNDFEKMAKGSEISAQEMIDNLTANLAAQQSWADNMEALWWQAFQNNDETVMSFLANMADRGPEFAGVVEEWANGGYDSLQEAATLWGDAAAEAADETAKRAEMEKTLMGDAAKAIVEEGQTAIEDTDFTSAGEQKAQETAAGITNENGKVQSAASSLAKAAMDSAKSVDFSPVGRQMAAGIAAGIRSGRSRVVSATVAVITAGLVAAKEKAEIRSPSRLFRREVGQMITTGIAEGMIDKDALQKLEDSGDVVTEKLKQMLGVSDNEDELAAVKAWRDAWEDALDDTLNNSKYNIFLAQKNGKSRTLIVKEYQKMLDELHRQAEEARALGMDENDEYLQELSRRWWEYHDDMMEVQKEIYESAVAELDDFLDAYGDAWDRLVDKRQSLEESMAAYGDLFSYIDEDKGTLALESINDQTRAIEEYGYMLQKLKKRGINAALLEEVLGMSHKDAWNFGSKLLELSDENWTEYMAAYQKKLDTAQAIASEFYKDDFDDMKRVGAQMAVILADAFEQQTDPMAQKIYGMFIDAYNKGIALATQEIKASPGIEDLLNIGTGMVNGLSTAITGNNNPVEFHVGIDIDGEKFAYYTYDSRTRVDNSKGATSGGATARLLGV